MTAVSANYRELLPSEVEAVAKECAEAWKHPDIPLRQYELCVRGELERFRAGEAIAPFDALIRCWRKIPWAAGYFPTVLDVGASSGYYREVLKIAGIDAHYMGIDYSEAFLDLQHQLWPDLDGRLDLGDACDLPYADDEFDIVLHSAVIMHISDYKKAIAEAARVARRWLIFNRTPVYGFRPTTFFEKEAYGIPCLELHFNEPELLAMFEKYNLKLRHFETIFRDAKISFEHRCYLLENVSLAHYPA